MNLIKIKSFSILFMLIFVSLNLSLFPSAIEEISEENQESIISPKDSFSNEVPSSIKQSVVDYDKLFLGESIKTDIEFNKATIDYYNPIHAFWRYLGTTTFLECLNDQSHIFNIYENDGQNYLVRSELINPLSTISSGQVGYRITYQMYCGGAGTFSYEVDGKYFFSPASFKSATKIYGTYSIVSTDLNSLGYIEIALNIYVDFTLNQLILQVIKINSAGQTTIDSSTLGSVTESSVDGFDFLVDYLYFQRTTITNNVRSEYKYASSTMNIHRLEIPSIVHAKEVNIYYPEHYIYSSINPYASITDASYTLTINNPTELTYSVLFNSNCTHLLTTKDISTNYLTDVGFEKGTMEDISNFVASKFDTYTIATDVVSEGYFSLKGMDSESASDNFNFNITYRGKLFCSFDYYLKSGHTWTDLKIYYRISDSAWGSQTFTLGSSDRWNKVFLAFDLEGWEAAHNRNFVIFFTGGQGIAYIDNLIFFMEHSEISTQGYFDYLFVNKLIAWDGYKNPCVIGQQTLNVTLLDKDTQVIEHTTNLTSLTGIFELNHSQFLEEKDYEIYTFSHSSGEFNSCSFYFTPKSFSEDPILSETDSNFYLSSTNNTYQYEIYLNEQFLGIYSDLELILRNNTVGKNNLTYVLFSNSENKAYIPATYSFYYEIERFYDVQLRYIPENFVGLAIGEFKVNYVLTYLDGVLVLSGDITDVPENSNYTFITEDNIRIRNNAVNHSLIITDLFGRLIINTTIDISAFVYAVLELPIYRLKVINLDEESHKLAIKPYLTSEKWQYTPELPSGCFLEYWLCDRTYSFRIYSSGSSYYEGGALIKNWDEYEELEPRKVPCVIKIPYIMSEEEEEEQEKEMDWRNTIIGVSVSTLALLVMLFIYLVKRKKDKELIK